MYGKYRVTLNLSETILDISRVMTELKKQPFDTASATKACAQYRQLSLVCACAFMMSTVGHELKTPSNYHRIRALLSKEIRTVYPAFASEQDDWWDHEAVVTVLTEMAFTFLMDIISIVPALKNVFGQPQLFTFLPTHIELSASGTALTFTLCCSPPATARLLA